MFCVHMECAGNDFLITDGREMAGDAVFPVRTVCDFTGADGFMVLRKSEIADFRLEFYNRDGSRADICGNGCRCICRFAYDFGIAREGMTVQTDAGVISGWRRSHRLYEVALPAPRSLIPQILPRVDYCLLGVPHAVVAVPELDKEGLRQEAQVLRWDEAFPQGCNVNFYTWEDEQSVQVLTYERGVEDFTAACGTGCAAIATILHHKGQLPGRFLVAHNPGGSLEMTVDAETGRILQAGKTKILGRLTIDCQ